MVDFAADMKCCFITKINRGRKLLSSIFRKMALLNSRRFALSPARKAFIICNLYDRRTKRRLNTRHAIG